MARKVSPVEWSTIKAVIKAHPRSNNGRIGRMRNIKRSSEVVRLVRHTKSFMEYRMINESRHDTEWHHNRPKSPAVKEGQASLFPLRKPPESKPAIPGPTYYFVDESIAHREYLARIGNVVGMGVVALIIIAISVLIALVRSWK